MLHRGLGAALLGGCAGGAGGFASPSASNANGVVHALKGSHTFDFTGSRQKFQVPSNVKRVTIAASGASGGVCPSSCTGYGTPGNGGYVKATIPVAPGETLYVFVGGDNGYNGGAVGSSGRYGYVNGGGASDVREGGDALKDRVVVAAGGGGGGYIGYKMGVGGNGGAGGGRAGVAGGIGYGYLTSGKGGSPGTQHYGGAGGAGGQYGPEIKAPRCRDGCGHCSGDTGGAGVLGTGGGGATVCGGPGGGGGGGSSFLEPRGFDTKEIKGGGAASSNGEIVIAW